MRRSEWSEEQRALFGRALRETRIAKGWTPAMLAAHVTHWLSHNISDVGGARMSITVSTIRRYENGEFTPNALIRKALGELLSMDFSEIVKENKLFTHFQLVSDEKNNHGNAFKYKKQRRLTKIYGNVISDFLQLQSISNVEGFQEYVGTYLVFRHSFNPHLISIIWLEIHQATDEYSVPHYRIFQRSSAESEIRGDGFVIASRMHLTCVGHRGDADLEMAILNRISPPVDFLVGTALTSTRERYTIAANVFCDKLSSSVNLDRNLYDELIRPLPLSKMSDLLRKIGKDDRFIERLLFHIDNRPRRWAKVLYGRTLEEKIEFDKA